MKIKNEKIRILTQENEGIHSALYNLKLIKFIETQSSTGVKSHMHSALEAYASLRVSTS